MFKRISTLAASIFLGLAMLCGILWLLAASVHVIRADTPPMTCEKITDDFTVITTLVGNCYYFVSNTVTIAPGVVVTIAPPSGGATLYFTSSTQVRDYGTLRALGQPGQHITFTSARANPERADWQGILFIDDGNPDDHDIIQYSTIEYARVGIQGGDEDFIDILSLVPLPI